MKRQAIITNIGENMTNIKRLMFSNLPNIQKNKPTMSQMGVMMIIAHLPQTGGKEISKYFNISPSASTQLIDGLVHKKLLSRKMDKEDKRKINLKLTESGEKILIEMKEQQMKLLTRVFLPLNDEELIIMDKLQKKVLGHIKK